MAATSLVERGRSAAESLLTHDDSRTFNTYVSPVARVDLLGGFASTVGFVAPVRCESLGILQGVHKGPRVMWQDAHVRSGARLRCFLNWRSSSARPYLYVLPSPLLRVLHLPVTWFPNDPPFFVASSPPLATPRSSMRL